MLWVTQYPCHQQIRFISFLTAHEEDVASQMFACAHVKANFTCLSSSLSPVCYKNTCLTIGLTIYHKYKIKTAPSLLNSQTRLPDYWLWPVSNFIKNVMILFFYCVILLSYLSSCCSVWPGHSASPCIVVPFSVPLVNAGFFFYNDESTLSSYHCPFPRSLFLGAATLKCILQRQCPYLPRYLPHLWYLFIFFWNFEGSHMI